MNESLLISKTADAKDHDSASPIHVIQPVQEGPESDLFVLRKTVQRTSCSGCGLSGQGIAAELVGMPPAQRASVMRGLQQTRGNRYVAHLAVQAKLRIGQPGDKYEQEADRVARQVVSVFSFYDQNSVQRQEDEEEQDEAEELRRKVDVAGLIPAADGADVEPGLESIIQGARGKGKPLSDDVRQPMERAFGADFGMVRLHTDGEADSLNRSIQARAFTTGQDIFLKRGEYRPGSYEWYRLLSHELTHVVQQANGPMVGGMQCTPILVQRVVSEGERRNAALLVGELQIEIAGIEHMMEQFQDLDNEEEEMHYSIWAAAVGEMIIALRALARGEEHEGGRRYLGQSVAQLMQEAERSVGEAAAGEIEGRESEVDLGQLETALRIQIAHAALAHDSGIHRGDHDAAARASLVHGFLADKLVLVRRMVRGDAVARRELGSLRGAPGEIIQRWARVAAAGLRERVSDRAIEEEMVILQRRVAAVQRRLEQLERLLRIAETIYRSAMAEGAAITVYMESLASIGRAVGAMRGAATAPQWLMAVRAINVRYNIYGGIWAVGTAFELMRENFSRIAQYREVFAQFMATRDDLEQNSDTIFLMERGLDGVRDEAIAVADEIEAILARLSELAAAE